MGKHEYKYLTKDFKKILDDEIKKRGKEAVYDAIEKNILTEEIAQLQNEPDAFKEINKGPWHTTKWELDFFTKPRLVDLDSLSQEMLYYVDKKRWENLGFKNNGNK